MHDPLHLDRPQRDSDILFCSSTPWVPYFQAQGTTAYVAGNNFLYYQRGNPPTRAQRAEAELARLREELQRRP